MFQLPSALRVKSTKSTKSTASSKKSHPKKRTFLRGAGSIAPRFFDSSAEYNRFFEKYIDSNTYSSLMFTITTISHKTSDCKQPLLMLTNREGYRYFFGKIPEGSQRVLNENGVRLGKLKSIFLTGTVKTWGEIGGLPGLFLTISDATSRGIDVFTNSSKVMSYVVATWRYFVFRRGIELNILDPQEQKIIGDSSTIFRPVKIQNSLPAASVNQTLSDKIHVQLKKLTSLMFPQDTSKANSRDPESYKSDPSDNEIQTHVRLPDPSQLVDAVAQPSLNYVIRFTPVRGKFDPVKAKALGVKPGVNFRNLTNGESVLNDQNELVHPSQVLEPSKSFPKIVILDIPDSHYLQNTINSDEWLSKSEDAGPEEVGLVYHFLGDDIDFSLEEYINFIKTFPSDCKHVISHSLIADDTLVFKTYAVHLLKLKCILNNSFNLPYMEEHRPLEANDNIMKLQSLQNFSIDPSGITLSNENVVSETWSSLYDKEVANTGTSVSSKQEVLEKAVLPLLLPGQSQQLKDLVQVVTLGTGSALPSIHRNVLSNLVRIPYIDRDSNEIKYNSILLDGGENTLGSLVRNFGHNDQEHLNQIFGELRLIYLSHLHADHHLGIISVISKWFKANLDNDKKLYLIIPWQYSNFVSEWYKLEQHTGGIDLHRIVYISCEEFMRHPEQELRQFTIDEFEERFDRGRLNDHIPKAGVSPPSSALIDQLYHELNIQNIRTVRAIHCYWSYSISLTFNLTDSEKFKVSFSGDTRPSTKFIDIGQGTDLLIHEASLDNDLIEEAIAKKHSTVVEAVKVSQLMDCPKVILTHFSARFSEKHSFIESAAQYEQMSNQLKSHIGSSTSNIFGFDGGKKYGFDDLLICYAYDLMNIRYKDLDCQKPVFAAINSLSASEITEDQKLKLEREMLKKSEKREAKRLQRLSGNRKRRLSNEGQ